MLRILLTVGREKAVPDVNAGIDWNGPITIIVTGLVSLMVEYFRRKMPPEPTGRRKDDPKENSLESPGYENEEELEDDDV